MWRSRAGAHGYLLKTRKKPKSCMRFAAPTAASGYVRRKQRNDDEGTLANWGGNRGAVLRLMKDNERAM